MGVKMIPHSKPTVGIKECLAASKCILRGQLVYGVTAHKLEKMISNYLCKKYCLVTNSGLSALHLALLGLEIKEKSQVIIPAFVCNALPLAVNYCNAIAVLSDVDYKTGNLSIKSVYEKINNKTSAIIVAHMFGYPCDIKPLTRTGIPIIEDCSLSLGAKINKDSIGCYGDVSIGSFYTTKMLASGEGGFVATNNAEIFEKIKEISCYRGKNELKNAYNYNMTNILASIAVEQMKKIDHFVDKRRQIASKYNLFFSKFKELEIPHEDSGIKHAYYRYIIKTKGDIRDELLSYLKDYDIYCTKSIYKPLYGEPFKSLYPNSEKLYAESLSIPIYPRLKKKEIKKIERKIENFFG